MGCLTSKELAEAIASRGQEEEVPDPFHKKKVKDRGKASRESLVVVHLSSSLQRQRQRWGPQLPLLSRKTQ